MGFHFPSVFVMMHTAAVYIGFFQTLPLRSHTLRQFKEVEDKKEEEEEEEEENGRDFVRIYSPGLQQKTKRERRQSLK